MEDQALNDAHKLFTSTGYKGDVNSFKTLLSTNENALNDAYSLFVKTGYKKDINSFKGLVLPESKATQTPTTYQWSSADQPKSPTVVQGADKVFIGEQRKQEVASQKQESDWEGGASKNYDKTDETLFKVAQLETDVSDETLQEEAEFGMNRSTLGNTQRVVNSVTNSKLNILDNPEITIDEFKADLSNKMFAVKKSVEDAQKQYDLEVDRINREYQGIDQMSPYLQKAAKEKEKKIQDLINLQSDIKDIYTTPEQREKLNPVVQLYKQDPTALNKISQEEFDKLTADYGAFLQYAGEEDLENIYLKARDLSNNFELGKKLSLEDGLFQGNSIFGDVNNELAQEEVQKVDRLGYLATLDDLSNIAKKQSEGLNQKYEEINLKAKDAATKEEIAELKKEWDALSPQKEQINSLVETIKQKAQEAEFKFKDLKAKEDYQKTIDYWDNLNNNSSGFGWAMREYANDVPKNLVAGVKGLLNLTKDGEERDLDIFVDTKNYEWDTYQIPSYYKNTPAVQSDSKSPLGIKLTSSALYTIGKVSAESLGLAAITALTGGSGAMARAGWGSLKGLASGAYAASTIVVPTMIMTSAKSTADYLNQGFSPDVANKLGILTGFIEGVTEVANPIEVGGSLKLTKLAKTLSNKGANQTLLNNIFKEVTGKVPSKNLTKLLLNNTKEFSKEFFKQGGLEVLEEELGLFFNTFKNKWAQKQKFDYEIPEEELLNFTNVTMTAINTMVSMPLLGAMGAGVNLYQQSNSALPTSRFVVGQNADLHLKHLEQDFKNKIIPKEVYDVAKQEIPKLKATYEANKFTIDNLIEEDEQIRFFNLANEQPTLAQKLLASPNDEKLSKQVEDNLEQIVNYQQKAIINSTKSPQEKYKMVEDVIIKAIDDTYTPSFIKNTSIEAAKKDLENRNKFIKSPKVEAKTQEILNLVGEKEQIETQKQEVVQQDEEYAQQKAQEVETPTEEIVTQGDDLFSQMGVKPVEVLEETTSTSLNESEKRVESKKEFDKISGVKTILVGSTARGEAKENSDIDIVLEGMPHQNKEKLNSEERQENSNYAYDTLKQLAENGIITEFELLPNGFGLSFKFNGHIFQVVPNPTAPKKAEEEKPSIVNQTTNVILSSNLTIDQEKQLLDQTEEDVTKANKSSENVIAKLTAIEENVPEEYNPVFKMIVTAFDKIAYQARKFTETSKGKVNTEDALNPEYSFLNSPEIGEGYEVVFKLDPTSAYSTQAKEQFKENKLRLLELGVLTEEEFDSYLANEDNFSQISITDKEGRNFGNLHTIDYIRESRVVAQINDEESYGDNLKSNLTTLIQTRKDILTQLRESKEVKATITNKTIGVLSTKADNSYVDVTEAFENKDVLNTLQIVIKPEEVILGSKPTVNTTALSNMIGNVVLLIPTPQGNNFSLGVKKKTLGEELASSAINAIKFYIEYNQALLSNNATRLSELDEINSQLVEKAGAEYDITDFDGLKKYISLFVYNNAKTSSFTGTDVRLERKDVPFIDFDTKDRSITFSNKRSFASKEADEEVSSLEKLKQVSIFKQYLFTQDGNVNENNDFFLNNFERFLTERSINVDANLLGGTQPFEIPLLAEDFSFVENERTKADNYKEYIIKNVQTNVLEHEITSPSGKKEFSYFQQPTFSFEIEKPKTTKKTKKVSKTKVYKESPEFKAKIEGFTPILNEANNEYYYKIEDSKITILNTKGNVLKPSSKNYPSIAEKVMTLNYEKLQDEIEYYNREFTEISEIEADSPLLKDGSQEWVLANYVGTILFNDNVNNTGRASSMFYEIKDMLDVPKEIGADFYKLAKKDKIFKTWLTNDPTKGQDLDQYVANMQHLYEFTQSEVLDFILANPDGTTKLLTYSERDMRIKSTLAYLSSEMGITVRPKSLNKIANIFYNVVNNIENPTEIQKEDVLLTEEELEEIKKEVDANFTTEEEFKYIEELNLSQNYQDSLKTYIDYENQMEQAESNQLDDSEQEDTEEETNVEQEDEDLDIFSFYDTEEDLTETPKINLENQYNNLSLVYNQLTKEQKQKIGTLESFINSYKNSEITPTEEFLIEELNCRKNK